jgi:gas vesicle protein
MSNNTNNNNNNINTKDFIIGSLVGGIVGAATALMLAPKSGKDLRTDLNDQAIVLKDRGNQLASRAKETSSSFAKSVSDQSSQVAVRVKDISNRFRQDDDQRNEDSVSSPDVLEEEYKAGKAEVMKDAMEDNFNENDREPASVGDQSGQDNKF